MRRYFICVNCAHTKHRFEIPKISKGECLPSYVYIDGEKFISFLRPPSKKVKCSECGKRTTKVFEPLDKAI